MHRGKQPGKIIVARRQRKATNDSRHRQKKKEKSQKDNNTGTLTRSAEGLKSKDHGT